MVVAIVLLLIATILLVILLFADLFGSDLDDDGE